MNRIRTSNYKLFFKIPCLHIYLSSNVGFLSFEDASLFSGDCFIPTYLINQLLESCINYLTFCVIFSFSQPLFIFSASKQSKGSLEHQTHILPSATSQSVFSYLMQDKKMGELHLQQVVRHILLKEFC